MYRTPLLIKNGNHNINKKKVNISKKQILKTGSIKINGLKRGFKKCVKL